MSTVTVPLPIPKAVDRKVRNLRWLVRGYVLVEGIAAVVIALCVAFWLCLLFDWFFEPTPKIRILMGAGVVLVVAAVAWKILFSRLFARLSDSSLALLVERTFPQIEQSLVTTIQGNRQKGAISIAESELFAHTSAEASHKLAQVDLKRVFRYGPLIWKVVAGVLLIGSIIGFAALEADAFEFFLARARLSTAPWPRRVQLQVKGFDEVEGQRVMNVARDDSFNLEVLASLSDEHVSPDQVEIRYRLPDGRRGRDSMTQIGEASMGKDNAQEFQYEFKNLSADMTFDLVGGDDRIRDLHLHVVERPQIVQTALDCEFPDYLKWAPQTLPFNGRVEVPEGAVSICLIEVNKPLKEVHVYDSAAKEQLPAELSPENSKQFTIPLGVAEVDRVLLVDVRDSDGVTNREPYRLMVSVAADEIPEVHVQLRGIGSAVTPQAVIPLDGTISDDHDVKAAWIEGHADKLEPLRQDLAPSAYSGREKVALGSLDLTESKAGTQERVLPLQAGQHLTLSVKAEDAYDLDGKPHVGSSQRFVLDVVTDSQLRALLEKRELGLRQRFEAIHEKMVATRDLLSRIELEPKSADATPLTEQERALRRERDKLRASGVLQNITQLTFETLGVAEGFEDIVIELNNNRIATEELTERLQKNIAFPLHEIAESLMPELESKVKSLPAEIDGKNDSAGVQTAAIIQSDAVIAAMQQILDRMLELESYNELVELLRGIVSEQKELNEATRLRHREKLRSLLDDE